MLHYKLDTKT